MAIAGVGRIGSVDSSIETSGAYGEVEGEGAEVEVGELEAESSSEGWLLSRP